MKPILETNPIIRQFKQEIQEEEEEYGFNISIVDYAEVVENDMRLDAEYWIENIKIKGIKIADILLKSNIRNIKTLQLSRNFNYLEISNIGLQNGFEFETTEIDFLDIPDRATYILNHEDICISTVRPNRNAVAFIQRQKRLIGTSGLCVLRVDKDIMNPYYVYIFCKTEYFIKAVMRENKATMYPAVSDNDIKKLIIPNFSTFFKSKIERMVKEAHFLLEESKKAYIKAEEMLLMEVLGEWGQEEWDFFWIEDLEETKKAERLDAEYFHPKYKELLEKIKSYKHGFCYIKEAFNQNKAIIEVKEKEYRYVEIGSVSTSTGEINPLNLLSEELPANAKMKLELGDLIISTVRAYRGAVAIIEEENLVGSSAFTILQETSKFKKEVLFVLLKTKEFRELSNKFATGMSYPVLTDNDILNYPIPNLQKEFQEEVARLVKTSFENRKRSRELLELAKNLVELAIEEGEEKAIQTLM